MSPRFGQSTISLATMKNVARAPTFLSIFTVFWVYGPGPSSNVRATRGLVPPPHHTGYPSEMRRSSVDRFCSRVATGPGERLAPRGDGLGGERSAVVEPPFPPHELDDDDDE